ncbi:MAG: hypothetical protein MUO63_16255 [Desulfobulbaceae bacterium]|nr:hypothetical protein [Desulfobulbaceae bacterium]
MADNKKAIKEKSLIAFGFKNISVPALPGFCDVFLLSTRHESLSTCGLWPRYV